MNNSECRCDLVFALFQVLYDGLCPICVTEIHFLQFLQRKKPEKVDFIDISLPGYDGRKYQEISFQMAMEEMHVIDKEDKVSMDYKFPYTVCLCYNLTVIPI